MVRGAELGGDELSAAECRALERHASDDVAARAEDARDLLTYELEIETDSGVRRVAFDEMNTPEGLAGLVRRMHQHSRPIPL